MASNLAARKDGSWRIVFLTPDFCFTPGSPSPVPYPVTSDLGNAKNAAALAKRLGTPVAAGAKERISDTQVQITAIIGDVQGRDVIVLDDEIANGGSMIELLHHLRQQGARTIRIACTHGIFAKDAVSRLCAQPDLVELVCTDGFLRPNAELDAAGLTNRKGFPESYDVDGLRAIG